MRDAHFEWDDAKADSNRRKHGVTFEEARAAFDDPQGLDEFDDESDEERWKRIGLAHSGVLVVIHTERGQRTRIISAGRAKRHEQELYYRQALPEG